MMKHVLVTGGAGSIGSNLSHELVRRGYSVTILDDLSSGYESLVPDEAHFIHGSINSDENLREAFDRKPDLVIHLAALFANQNSVDHPQLDLEVNGKGLLRVLEFAKKSKVEKLLYTSSSCVYGHKQVMSEEDTDLQPETPYAITKLLGEQYCKFWSSFHGLDTVIVRLFNTYGPGEFPGKYRNVIPNFFSKAMEKAPLVITGTGEETRDFTFVKDSVNGILSALFTKTDPGEIFNLCTGASTCILDLAQLINQIAGSDTPIEFVPRRSWDSVSNRRGNPKKAQQKLTFAPSVPLREGLNLTYQWLKKSAC